MKEHELEGIRVHATRLESRLTKTLRTISVIILYGFFPVLIAGLLVVGLIFERDFKLGDTVEKIFLTSTFILGAFACITLSFVGVSSKKVTADRFSCVFENYDVWEEHLLKSAALFCYQPFREEKLARGKLVLCINDLQNDPLSCISIIRTPQISDDLSEQANDRITDLLKEYLHCNTIRSSVDMISIFCVDKVSPAFYSLVNDHMVQGHKNGRLVAGISFGRKRIYIGNFGDGYGKRKYQKLREQFIVMAGLEGQKPISRN